MIKLFRIARLGWILMVVGISIYLAANRPYVVQHKQMTIDIGNVTAWLDQDESARLEQSGKYEQFAACTLGLDASSPRILRIGKTGNISLAATMNCPAGVDFQNQVHLRTKLVEQHNQVSPIGEIVTLIQTGQVVRADWAVNPSVAEEFSSTLWVYLDFSVVDGQLITMPIASIPIQSGVDSILGLDQRSINRILISISLIGLILVVINWIVGRSPWRKKNHNG